MESFEFMEVQRELDDYLKSKKRELEMEHSRSILKVLGSNAIGLVGRPTNEDGFRSMQAEVRKRDLSREPQLFNDYGNPILSLLLYTLPSCTTIATVKNLLTQNNISFNSCKMCLQKKRLKSAVVNCSSLRDSLKLQILAIDNKIVLTTTNNDIEYKYTAGVTPTHRALSAGVPSNNNIENKSRKSRPKNYKRLKTIDTRCNSVESHIDSSCVCVIRPNFSQLHDVTIQNILQYLSFKDQFMLMLSSKELSKRIMKMIRLIEFPMGQKTSITTRNVHSVINPYKVKINDRLFRPLFKKIVFSDPVACNKVNGNVINKLLAPGGNKSQISTNDFLIELDLSGIKISPNFLEKIAFSCPNLEKFILGNTNGSCDSAISVIFSNSARTKNIKTFGVSNNNNFSGLSLVKSDVIRFRNLILLKCKKLQLTHFQKFIAENVEIEDLQLINCSHVHDSPRIDKLLDSLGLSQVKKLTLIHDDEPYSAYYKEWRPDAQWGQKAETVEELMIKGYHGVDCSFISKIIAHCPNLRHFYLRDFLLPQVNLGLNKCPIETVDLTGRRRLPDAFLLQTYQQIKVLSLNKVKVSCGEALRKFIERSQTTLQVVDLTDTKIIEKFKRLIHLEDSPSIFSKPPIKVIMKSFAIKTLRDSSRVKNKPSHPIAIFIDSKTFKRNGK